jgi:hypothetical protein
VRGSSLIRGGGGQARFEHTVWVLQDVVVPDPKYTITGRLKPLITFRVLFIAVLTAIPLNNEFELMADEISNETPHRRLAAKLQVLKP